MRTVPRKSVGLLVFSHFFSKATTYHQEYNLTSPYSILANHFPYTNADYFVLVDTAGGSACIQGKLQLLSREVLSRIMAAYFGRCLKTHASAIASLCWLLFRHVKSHTDQSSNESHKRGYSTAQDRSVADESQFDGEPRTRSLLSGIVLDGDVSEWSILHRSYPKVWELPTINPNFEIFGMHDKTEATYYFAIKRTDAGTIAAKTTIYLDTDQSTSSATSHGLSESEFYIDFVDDGTGVPVPHLYNPNPWAWLGQLQHSFSADKKTVEIAVPEALIGGAATGDIDFLVDVNDAKYFPVFFGAPWYTATSYELPLRTADPNSKRVAIVFSPESEKTIFGGGEVNKYIYGQLYASIQHQCMMAGLPYDLIYINELKNLEKIVNYDALVFAYNAFAQESDYDMILRNIRLAVHHYGIGIVTGDNFLTDLASANANVTLENPYKAMWEVFGLTINGYGSGNLTITAVDSTHPVMKDYTAGEQLLEYQPGFYNHYGRMAVPGLFESSSTVTALAKTNDLHDSLLAINTVIGTRLVHFATITIMADANLMWQALRWVVFGDDNPVGLQISRQNSVFSSRNDMDQTRFPYDFERVTKALYEQYLVSWHQMYDFVGTDFINIGNDQAQGEYTDWAVSGPMYQKYMGKRTVVRSSLWISYWNFHLTHSLVSLQRIGRRDWKSFLHPSILHCESKSPRADV